MSRSSFLLLGLVATTLSGVILRQLDPVGGAGEGLPQAAPRAARPTSDAAPAVSPSRAAELAATILARPLFNPDRRPAPPVTADTARAADAVLPRLTGTLVTGGGRNAIFAGSGRGAALIVQEGGRIGAYAVQAIEPGRVTLAGPDGLLVVAPSFEPSRPAEPPGRAPTLPGIRAGSLAPPLAVPDPLPTPVRPPVDPGTVPGLSGPGLPRAGSISGAEPGGPSSPGLGTAEGDVPFEQNTAPSGLDILRNSGRNNPTDPSAGGTGPVPLPGIAR